ncbi:hypothetical protein [Taibaiella soli]|uniref:Porin n=1 Tax=Taibaiella soli TaxID=1649169 RepID=A0A2W2ABH8_9BACT|nr:hypothetical protein [Taibaiella soli]PZF70972.1 hypothetical protein DN068_19890 [Taibaiella soli]
MTQTKRLLKLALLSGLLLGRQNSKAQALVPQVLKTDSTVAGVDHSYPNEASGEFTPGKGFDLVRTKAGSLNISLYTMVRYLNQLPGQQTWQDHLGRDHDLTGRNDIYWHRSMIWFSGFLLTPKLRYTATVWTIFPTQQTLVYGNLQYRFNKYLTIGAGVLPNMSVRSMQGPFPFYLSTDRTMGEESLRAGFTNGVRATGEPLKNFYYTLFVGDNLSILGVQASRLTRFLSSGVGLMWMPTTGEYGPRGGLVDFEVHDKVSTRFGANYTHCRDNRFNNVGQPSPDNTQIRLTDGVLFFETGALADGVTVQEANYDMVTVDAGFKYKGLNVQAEMYNRYLTKIDADGPLPLSSIHDIGYSLQVSQMVVPKVLALYAIHSYFFDQFKRHPWEIGGGADIYPMKSRSWRLNAQVHYVYKSSAGGTFGLYNAGQTGTTITVGTDVLL